MAFFKKALGTKILGDALGGGAGKTLLAGAVVSQVTGGGGQHDLHSQFEKMKLTPQQLFDQFKEKIHWDTAELDGVLRISIMKAHGIRDADGAFGGKSDPYVMVYIDNHHKVTSSVKDDTLNPVWKEFFEFPIKGKFEHLIFQLWDKDNIGDDDFLGEVRVSAKDLWEHRIIKGENSRLLPRLNPNLGGPDKNTPKKTDDKKKEKKESSKDEPPQGSFDFIAEYKPPSMDGHLSIKIDKADGCRSSDAALLNRFLGRDSKGDPYCCVLLDAEPLCHTKVIKNTFDPVWNESFEIDIAGEYTNIFLSLWDEDPGLDDYISHLQISTKELREKGKIAGEFPLIQQESKKKEAIPMGHISFSITWTPPHLDGRVEAKILKALDLISHESFFSKLVHKKSDAFVEMLVDGFSKGKTKVCHSDNAPVWNETITFDAAGQHHQQVSLVVWDGDANHPSHALGVVEVSTQELVHFKTVKGEFVLHPFKGAPAAGTLFIEVHYTPK